MNLNLNLRTAHMCMHHYSPLSYTTQQRAVLIIFLLNLQNKRRSWELLAAWDCAAMASLLLCGSRLANSICAQIKDSVRRSHAIFETSLMRLEAHHNGRLKETEKQRLSVRKEYAPRIARLALESRSLRDLILYGLLSFCPFVPFWILIRH